MHPDETDLYGGLAGANLEVDEFDLGDGLILSSTYAYLMAPFLVAFSRPEPGKPHPAPWRGVSDGFAFDIIAQLFVPREFNRPNFFNRINTIWWITCLLRLRASQRITTPVISSQPFAEGPNLKLEMHFWPIEVEPRRLLLDPNDSTIVRVEDLEWVRTHWRDAGGLMSHPAFALLAQALDRTAFAREHALGLVSLWGALEVLFCNTSAVCNSMRAFRA